MLDHQVFPELCEFLKSNLKHAITIDPNRIVENDLVYMKGLVGRMFIDQHKQWAPKIYKTTSKSKQIASIIEPFTKIIKAREPEERSGSVVTEKQNEELDSNFSLFEMLRESILEKEKTTTYHNDVNMKCMAEEVLQCIKLQRLAVLRAGAVFEYQVLCKYSNMCFFYCSRMHKWNNEIAMIGFYHAEGKNTVLKTGGHNVKTVKTKELRMDTLGVIRERIVSVEEKDPNMPMIGRLGIRRQKEW